MATRISAIVISRNEGARLRRTVENLDRTLPAGSEIIVVDDASVDGSTEFLRKHRRFRLAANRVAVGVARARNQGARASSGDVLVFCDAHIGLDDDWWRPLMSLVASCSIAAAAPAMAEMPTCQHIGYGLTLPKPNLEARWRKRRIARPAPAPILPGACMALRRDVFDRTGGYDEAMLAAGNVDNEMCLRLWLLGFELWITPETVVSHHFRKRMPYPLPDHFSIHNRLRLALVHFSAQRLDRVVGTLQEYAGFGDALLLAVATDAAARRKHLEATRVRSDDWFFKKFRLDW
jgi:GT2 family glycosyltransferase